MYFLVDIESVSQIKGEVMSIPLQFPQLVQEKSFFLRLPDTFAGVLREKKYLRAVLNATIINYISVQS